MLLPPLPPLTPQDPNLMNHKPRPADEEIMTPELLIRYMITGLYIGLATVGVYASYYSSRGVSPSDLGSWSSCTTEACGDLFGPEGLAMPQTLALTTLVTTELLNALLTVSVDSSIFEVGPQENPWLILGVTVPFLLNLVVIYSQDLGLPLLGESFGLVPLSGGDWINVLAWSLPIVLVDEALKAYGRSVKRE